MFAGPQLVITCHMHRRKPVVLSYTSEMDIGWRKDKCIQMVTRGNSPCLNIKLVHRSQPVKSSVFCATVNMALDFWASEETSKMIFKSQINPLVGVGERKKKLETEVQVVLHSG